MRLTQACGIAGISLFLLFFLICLYSSLRHFVPYHSFSTRKLFHLLITSYAALQTLSFYSLSYQGHLNKWTYTCHIYALVAEICCISLVCILWSKAMISKKKSLPILIILVALDFLFVGFMTYVAIILNMQEDPYDTWRIDNSLYDSMFLAESITLMTNIVCLLYVGCLIRKPISNHPSLETEQKRVILCRLIGTMAVCTFYFTSRSCFLLYVYATDSDETLSRELLVLLTIWIPSVVPAAMMLYTMKRPESAAKHPGQSFSNSVNHGVMDQNPANFPQDWSNRTPIKSDDDDGSGQGDRVIHPLLGAAEYESQILDSENEFGKPSPSDFFQGAAFSGHRAMARSFRQRERNPDSEFSDA